MFLLLSFTSFSSYTRGYAGYVQVHEFAESPEITSLQVDWRPNMSAVKDQGACGSCYAESAVAAFEGAWSLETGHIHNFSVQEAMDCLGTDCDGGWMHEVFEWMRGGILLDSQDPYVASEQECIPPNASIAFLQNWSYVYPSQKDLLNWVSHQPVSIAVYANECWDGYTGGLLDANSCAGALDPPELNHGVVAVGYDLRADEPHWIVRNSWGSSWGEDGHVRIAINMSQEFGLFGLAKQPTVPHV